MDKEKEREKKVRSKSDSHILETGHYYQQEVYGYDTVDSNTIFNRPTITGCDEYSPVKNNGTCRHCYKSYDDHIKTHNDSNQAKSMEIVRTGWFSWLWKLF
mgnify:CR=1 FL=1|uniref:Uncharacterized protein n=1 Tax=viral metagenome TaxID=1070528 RepID=A0A6C0EIU7_9ZZZZ